jgi:hypothetical protein
VIEGFPGRVPPDLGPDAEPMHKSSERLQHAVVHA